MASLKSSLRKTANSLGANKLIKNDMFTNVALVILVILTFNYLNTRQYQATIFMYIVAVAGYYMCKSLSCGLLAAIVLTNLLISMNYFKISESFKEEPDSKKEKELTTNDMQNLDDALKKLKQIKNKK
mgnify:CR=1 FL=1|tara:strand:- start:2 stop:385 length:384 start_codon:yes stop_codon:yes gene_type:complete